MPLPDWFASGQNEAIFLRRLLDHISDCLVMVDTEGRIVLINEPYCRLLGGSPEEFVGHHITEVVSPKTKLHRVAKGEMVIAGAPLEVRGQHLFTRQVPVLQDGRIIGAVGTALFSSLGALKKAASIAARQELSIQNPQRGWAARYTMEHIAGTGGRMDALRERIRQAAGQSQPVLIQGESGTGKELAANAIHAHSDRSRQPFVWINCASMPESLIESELFGYEGGAFTGAHPRGKQGKFELADGGTLFLDEIGDMPVHLQASLLRAVQNQEIVRVGGTSPIPIDVRIVCATNRPLEELVRTGLFRLDLYYRLNVLNIRMPALRERDDLEYLIDYLLKRIAQQESRPVRKMPKPVLAKLQAFPWPGNVRQLENALLRFLISGDADLDQDIMAEPQASKSSNGDGSLNLDRHLDRQREALIRQPIGWPLQWRVIGPDLEVLRTNAFKLAELIAAHPGSKRVHFDWIEPGRQLRIQIDQDAARRLGLTSQQLANTLSTAVSGSTVTQLRDDIYLVNVVARADARDRVALDTLATLQVPVPGGRTATLSSFATFSYEQEQPQVWRRDRVPTLTVLADVEQGWLPETVVVAVRDNIAKFNSELPAGYRIELGGTAETSAESQAAVFAVVPIMIIIMLTLLMIQLKEFGQVGMVVILLPLGLIGVVGALLLFNRPLGFVAILGILALIGMIAKNAVILLSQFSAERDGGASPREAAINAAMARARPLVLTAISTVLGLIPIAPTLFWGPMAFAIMGGLLVATVLMLIFLPTLYVTWFERGNSAPAKPAGATA